MPIILKNKATNRLVNVLGSSIIDFVSNNTILVWCSMKSEYSVLTVKTGQRSQWYI